MGNKVYASETLNKGVKLWLCGKNNLWFSCFTERISVWSALLTLFWKLWFLFKASVSLSSVSDVIQT